MEAVLSTVQNELNELVKSMLYAIRLHRRDLRGLATNPEAFQNFWPNSFVFHFEKKNRQITGFSRVCLQFENDRPIRTRVNEMVEFHWLTKLADPQSKQSALKSPR